MAALLPGMLMELWGWALRPGCAAPGWHAACRSEDHAAGQHPLWTAGTDAGKWPEPPAPLAAVCAEVAADQTLTETQGYTESFGSPPEVFGNPLLRSGIVPSSPELAGLLSPQSLQWHYLSLRQLGWR